MYIWREAHVLCKNTAVALPFGCVGTAKWPRNLREQSKQFQGLQRTGCSRRVLFVFALRELMFGFERKKEEVVDVTLHRLRQNLAAVRIKLILCRSEQLNSAVLIFAEAMSHEQLLFHKNIFFRIKYQISLQNEAKLD